MAIPRAWGTRVRMIQATSETATPLASRDSACSMIGWMISRNVNTRSARKNGGSTSRIT